MSRTRSLVVGWSAAAVAISVFCLLGNWQLRRMHEKQHLLDQARQVTQVRRPVALGAAAEPARADGHDWAAGAGWFADVAPVRLDNQSFQDRPGMRAYRLFVPDHGVPLLVELGWQPLGRDRSQLPEIARIVGKMQIAGLLMPPPSHGLAAAVSEMAADGSIITTSLNAADLPERLHQRALPPRILRLDPAVRLGYVRDLDVLPNTLPPAHHLGYAVQWFGLALTVLITALVLTFRRPGPRSPS